MIPIPSWIELIEDTTRRQLMCLVCSSRLLFSPWCPAASSVCLCERVCVVEMGSATSHRWTETPTSGPKRGAAVMHHSWTNHQHFTAQYRTCLSAYNIFFLFCAIHAWIVLTQLKSPSPIFFRLSEGFLDVKYQFWCVAAGVSHQRHWN